MPFHSTVFEILEPPRRPKHLVKSIDISLVVPVVVPLRTFNYGVFSLASDIVLNNGFGEVSEAWQTL